jgi:hypothetical protein
LKGSRIARNCPAVIFARTPIPVVSALLVTAAGALFGCATTAPTAGNTPITGIVIQAEGIVAGHGCGTGVEQVFKYAAVVSTPAGITPAFRTSAVFDCFADGVFSNLPSLDGGSQTFDVSVFAYNQASFPNALSCGPNTLPCPGDDAGEIGPWQASANWTATCTVTQLQGVPSVTTCGALEPNDAGSRGDDSSAME